MGWIDNNYDLVWDNIPPVARELKNFKFSLDNQNSVTKAISDMIEAGAASVISLCVRPALVSPLGVVAKPHFEKLQLINNTMYVNKYLTKRVFKLEGLSDLADMAETCDYSISYDLTSGYYHVALHQDSRRFVGFKWKGMHCQYNCLPFGLSTAP